MLNTFKNSCNWLCFIPKSSDAFLRKYSFRKKKVVEFSAVSDIAAL